MMKKVSCAANPFTDNSLMVFLVLRPFTRCSRADIKRACRQSSQLINWPDTVQVVVVQKSLRHDFRMQEITNQFRRSYVGYVGLWSFSVPLITKPEILSYQGHSRVKILVNETIARIQIRSRRSRYVTLPLNGTGSYCPHILVRWRTKRFCGRAFVRTSAIWSPVAMGKILMSPRLTASRK